MTLADLDTRTLVALFTSIGTLCTVIGAVAVNLSRERSRAAREQAAIDAQTEQAKHKIEMHMVDRFDRLLADEKQRRQEERGDCTQRIETLTAKHDKLRDDLVEAGREIGACNARHEECEKRHEELAADYAETKREVQRLSRRVDSTPPPFTGVGT